MSEWVALILHHVYTDAQITEDHIDIECMIQPEYNLLVSDFISWAFILFKLISSSTITTLFTFYEVRVISFCCCLVTRPCHSFATPVDCSLPGPSVHGISQAIILEWVAILQVIFPTQGSNPHLLHFRRILLLLSHQGSPRCLILLWIKCFLHMCQEILLMCWHSALAQHCFVRVTSLTLPIHTLSPSRTCERDTSYNVIEKTWICMWIKQLTCESRIFLCQLLYI